MSNNNNHQLGEAPWLHVIISTGLGVGFWPWGPGTLGGFVCATHLDSPLFRPFAYVACHSHGSACVGTLFVGVWTDNVMERYWGEDPRTVIIDEYFGTWVATLAALFVDGPSYVAVSLATIGFVLFRVIDITKPLGCRWVDRHIHGGWGCMLDDALAGFYAMCLTLIIRYAGLVEYVHDLLS